MDTINWDTRLLAIRGARGVGKTTLLLQRLKLNYPDKIYIENPNLLYTLTLKEVNAGTLCEVFISNQLAYQHRLEYCSRNADYTIDDRYTLKVGGKSKDGKQLTGEENGYIAADNVEYAAGNKIPLWAFGMMY